MREIRNQRRSMGNMTSIGEKEVVAMVASLIDHEGEVDEESGLGMIIVG